MPRGVYVRCKLKRRKKKPAKYVPPLSPAYRKTPWVSVSVRAEHYTMLRELGEFYEKPMTSVIATLIATQPVEVEYEKLTEEHGLPEQIDLIAVNLTLAGKTGRKRKVDILQLLNETEVIDLEDEIEKGEKDDD